MNTITKYLAKNIYIAFIFTLFAFIALFIFFDFLGEVKSIGKENYSILLALAHVALQIPDRFYAFSPIAALIAGVFVLSRLSIKSEFIILRTCGMPPQTIVKLLMYIGLPIVVIIFLLGEFISPMTERIAQNIRMQALGEKNSNLKSGIWLKNDSPKQKQFIRIGTQQDNNLYNVYIYKFSPSFNLQQVIYAKEAIIKFNEWHLYQNKILNIIDNKNTSVNSVNQSTSFNNKSSANISQSPHIIEFININPNFFKNLKLNPEQLSITELYQYINYLKINKQNTFKYKLAFAKKIIYPFSALLMLFLCIPFAYLHGRNGGIGIKMFMGIMLGLSFYLFYTLFTQLGNLSTWSIWFIQLTPFIVYSFLGIIAYIIVTKKG